MEPVYKLVLLKYAFYIYDTKADVRTYTATSQQIFSTPLHWTQKKTHNDKHSDGQVWLRDTTDSSTDREPH